MSQSTMSPSEVIALEPLLATTHCKAWWLPAKAGPQQPAPCDPVAQEGAGAVVDGLMQTCLSIVLAEEPSFSLVFVQNREIGGGSSEEGCRGDHGLWLGLYWGVGKEDGELIHLKGREGSRG